MLTQEILNLLPENLKTNQLSQEAIAIIEKVYRGEELSEQELSELLNATEVAAVLSAKHHRPVSHRYIKEITRPVNNKKTGHITPARLTHDRKAGTAYLYKVSKVLAVKLRQSA